MRADLTDAEVRRQVLADATQGSSKALVVTEGLLLYLTREHVAALAGDLHAAEPIRTWLTDLASSRLLKWMQRSWGKKADQGNAAFRFAPAEGTAFFDPFGWREAAFRSTGEEAYRLGRDMPGGWLWRFLGRFMSAEKKEDARRMAGIVLLERA